MSQPPGGGGHHPRHTTDSSPVSSGLRPLGFSQVLMRPLPSHLQTFLPLVNPQGPPLPDPDVSGLLLPTSLQHTASLQGVPSSSCMCLIVSVFGLGSCCLSPLGMAIYLFLFFSGHFCGLKAPPNCHLLHAGPLDSPLWICSPCSFEFS